MEEHDYRELERLAQAGRIDDLLELVSLDDAAQAWCDHHLRTKGLDPDPNWWTIELQLGPNVGWSSEHRRDFILKLVEAAPDELLGVVGAGPLEDFVDFDETSVDWIEEQAAKSPRFRQALANVWLGEDEVADTHARLECAAGVPIRWTGH